MRRLLISCSVGLLLVMFSGCTNEQQINDLTSETRLFSERVGEYQDIVMEMKNKLVEDNIINKSTSEKVDAISTKLDESKPILDNIVIAVEEGADTEEKVTGGLLAASSLIPPPYGELLLAGLGIYEVFRRRKDRETVTALVRESGKRRSEKAGTEKTIRDLAASDGPITADGVRSSLYSNIGNERARNGLT